MLKFSNDHIDYVYGQNEYRLTAKTNNEPVGFIDYSEYRGTISIKMIHVFQKRVSIGTQLIKFLQSLYPDTELQWGMMTEEGAALYDSLPKKQIENKPWKRAIQKMLAMESRLDEMQTEYDSFETAGDLEKLRLYIDKHGDKWNKLQSMYDELQRLIGNNSAYKTIIEF